MSDVIYLRKSRADADLETRSDVDVLARHESELRRNAQRLGRTVTQVYREVVSGDTIADRPMMQRLLYEVEAGQWEAVHVAEVSRLARGDTIDQGIVARAFQFSNTLIITPAKIIDPNNEFDSDFFEFDLFMSRREYKMITRRQQRGRRASVREGKWPSNKAPFGYDRVKLTGEKGWTLSPNDSAPVVRDIFAWYTSGGLGVARIVRRLNETGIASPSGKDWTNAVIRGILSNPAYAGFVRWGSRAAEKRVEAGEVVVSRPRNKECLIAPGRHPALISQEVFDRAQAQLSENKSRPGPKQVSMKNPLSGLVYCSRCGRAMIRRPYKDAPASFICPYTSCATVGSSLPAVEEAIQDALRKWLAELNAGIRPEEFAEADELAAVTRAISEREGELEQLKKQLARIYALTEEGVYTSQDFIARSRENAARREAAEKQLSELKARSEELRQMIRAKEELAPTLRHVLDSYPTSDAEEKNALLRSVISRIEYTKTRRDRWTGGGDMSIKLSPRIPFPPPPSPTI